MTSNIAVIDSYRTIAAGAISGTFAAVGSKFTHMIRAFCVTNNTDGDLIFSTDGSSLQLFVAAHSFKLFDVCGNREVNAPFYLPANTQFYVKQSTAPTTGAVYIEAIYGQGE